MSEFKYLRVVDKKPEKKIRVRKAIKSVSREIVEEFNSSGLKYALVRVPEGKTVKGIARAIGRMIKNMKLSKIAVYIATDDEVALYRKPIHPTELTSIRGIGDKRAEKLQSCGVRSVKDLASFDPKELSEKLKISEKRSSKWVAEAKEILNKKGCKCNELT